MLTLSRAETVAYFLDDNLQKQKDGFQVCGGIKPVYAVEYILRENLDETVVLISDHRLYPDCKLRLESLGLIENVHFFDGWRLNINFYRLFEAHDSWAAYEKDAGAVDFSQWERRTENMAALIPGDVQSIMDLGCGNGALKKYLPPRIQYFGLDAVRRDEDTIVCDVNNSPLPAIRVDAYYMAGFLMYVNNIERLLMQMRGAKYLIFSTLNYSRHLRLDTAIDSDYRFAMNTRDDYVWFYDIISMLRVAGFTTERVIPLDVNAYQHAWLARNMHWEG